MEKQKLNKEWHLAHKMPKNPTPDQRYTWHIEHSKKCSCREMSDKLKKEIEIWQKSKQFLSLNINRSYAKMIRWLSITKIFSRS